jgi:hypothetical protein
MGSGISNTVLPVAKYKVDLIYSKLLLDDTILGGMVSSSSSPREARETGGSYEENKRNGDDRGNSKIRHNSSRY